MPHTREIIMVRMVDDDDRFVTRPVMIPVHAREIAVMIPDLQNASLVNIDVCPYPHMFNYPTPNYYRVKPAGNNPFPHPFPVSYGFTEGGVVAEWRFDDPDGTTITDEVTGLVLTEQGDPTFQATAATAGLGSGVVFDGTGDAFDILIAGVASGIVPTTGDFTVELVVDLDSGSGGAGDTLIACRTGAAGVGWQLQLDANEYLDVHIEDSDGEVAQEGATDICTDATLHIVCSFDRDGNLVTYLDGVADATTDISSKEKTILPADGAANRLSIGGDAARTGGDCLFGEIFFARLYNRALSADEVLHNYRVLVGNEWPGWTTVIDQADGAAADACASGKDPCSVDVTKWLMAHRGMYARLHMASEQTTSRTYDFGWVFSGVT